MKKLGIKHKFKKFLCGIMPSLMLMTSLTMPVSAATTSTIIYDTSLGWSFGGSSWGEAAKITIDGQTGYCLERLKTTYSGASYTNVGSDFSSLGMDSTTVRKLSLLTYFAKQRAISSNNQDWYAIGQSAVWAETGQGRGWILSPTFDTDDKVQNAIQTLQNDVAKYYVKPSFAGTSSTTVKAGETIRLTDKNGVLSTYKVASTDGLTVKIEGNDLVITGTTEAKDTSTIKFIKNISASDTGSSFMWMSGDLQKVGTFRIFDPLGGNVKINVQKYGSVKLTKYDDEGLTVPNTSFKLSYNADMSSPIGTYTTGADGSVQIDELTADKTVYYQEVSVPAPLVIDTTIRQVTIEANQVLERDVTNLIQKGSATLVKVDAETGNKPQGDAVFTNAKYELRAKENIVNPINNRVLYHAGDVVATRVMRSDGTTDAVTDLYTGKYEWVEVEAPKGYLLTAGKIEVDLTYQGQNVTTITKNSTAMENVIKGKHQIFKTSTDGGSGILNGLKDAQFTYKLLSEVEKVGWDAATTYDVITTNDAGFAITKDLPYGTYLVKETFTPENKKTAPDFTITISENGKTYFNAINDAPFKSYVKLVKQDEDGKTVVLNSATFQIYDESGNAVIQKVGDKYIDKFTTDESGTVTTPLKLDAGKYTITEMETPAGFLTLEDPVEFEITNRYDYDLDRDDDPILTVVIKNEKPTGKIILNKTFEREEDAALGGATFRLTALEDVVNPADGSIIYHKGDAVNVDIAEDGRYRIDESGQLVIEGLPLGMDGVSYQLEEIETVDGYALLEKPIIFDFNIKDNTTKEYTIEKEVENVLIKLHTTALGETGKEQQVSKNVTITDTVTYEGLTVGKEYTVKGKLMDKATGEALLVDGKAITAEKTFTAETRNGEVELAFTFDGSALAGTTTVVFEDLYYEGRLITTHSDINDTDQTVKLIDIHTNAFVDGEKKIEFDPNTEEDKDITLTDTVTYEGLTVGKEYTVKGKLMDKATGEALLVDGKAITATATFTPNEENGTVDVTFILNTSALIQEHDIVVFEKLKDNDKVIATHEDINDTDQTVKVDKKELLLTDIQVNKVDSATKEVVKSKDFVFGIYSDEECKMLISKVHANKQNGTATFEDLPFGTYYIKELEAPKGYQLSKEVKKIVINYDLEGVGDVHSFIYENTLLPATTIKTGDDSNNAVLLFTCMLSLGGIVMTLKRRRKYEE